MKRLIFVTGPPKTGKTTVLLRAVEKLIAKGYRLGGMVSQEIREKGIRVGFEILDYTSSRKGWLAHIRQPKGPRIGKYRVNLDDLDSIGTRAILDALEVADIVLIDEIGPMELFSEAFKDAVKKVVNSYKPVLGTIHHRAQHSLITQIKLRKDADIIEINRETTQLPTLIADKIIKFYKQKICEG